MNLMIKARRALAVYSKKLRAAENGMTLIEMLVALTIFSVVVVAFTVYFMNTFLIVHIAAMKSETLFTAQAEAEEQIDTIVGDEDTLQVHYPGLDVSARGKVVAVEEEDNEGRVVHLEVFVPHVLEQSEED